MKKFKKTILEKLSPVESALHASKLLSKYGLKGYSDKNELIITGGKIENLKDFLDEAPKGYGNFGTSTGSYLANSIYGKLVITYKKNIWG
jgi:hypothetical protein